MNASRPYPWSDLIEALGDAPFEEIKGALAAAGTDPFDRDAFVLLAATGRALRELIPADAPAEALTFYSDLLHSLYLHWAAGRPVRTVDRDRLSQVLAAPPPPSVSEAGAWYVQLPERLVWAAPGTGAAHEPFDGMFVTATPQRVEVLAVLGFRPERDGFTTMRASVPLPLPAPPARADGSTAFATMLPAGERMGFHSVTSVAELAWLALLALAEGRS